MTRFTRPLLLGGTILLVVSALGGCIETTTTKPLADAGGPDKSIAVATDVRPGSGQDFILNVGRRTFFKEGSAELDSVARETLDKQADWLNRHPGWAVKIQGFADDPGSKEANSALSNRRAEAVVAYLASQGVSAGRLKPRGYGRERLVRDCPDLSCRAQNRRVITNLEGEKDV